VTGLCDAPVVGVLYRYHRSLQHAQPGTFAAFLRDVLPRCTFAVSATQVTVTGDATTTGYTTGQWHAINQALTNALSALGAVAVVAEAPHRPRNDAGVLHGSSHKGVSV
jgi:hypothetical protein